MTTRRDFFKQTVGTLTATVVFGHGIKAEAEEAVVAQPEMFAVGDLVQVPRTRECILITSVSDDKITFTKGFGNTRRSEIRDDDEIVIVGSIEPNNRKGVHRAINDWYGRKLMPRVFKGKDLWRKR